MKKIWEYRSIILNCFYLVVGSLLILIVPSIFLSIYFIDDGRLWIMIDFIKNISWPLIMLIFILLFRKNIAKFVDELKHLKIFGNEAERETSPEKQLENTSVEKMTEKVDEEINDTIPDELERTKRYLEFERIYNIIFGSQIELLEIMKLNKEGININFLQIFFHNIQGKFSPVLDRWTLAGYLKFLEINNLISFNYKLNSYSITEKGLNFLIYIDLLKYSKIKNL